MSAKLNGGNLLSKAYFSQVCEASTDVRLGIIQPFFRNPFIFQVEPESLLMKQSNTVQDEAGLLD
jgi:hypothetical protein